jgi:hypothetical protein
MRKSQYNDARQLSLFEPTPETLEQAAQSNPSNGAPSVLELVKARLEHGPEMTPDDYKRWIRILVQASIKRMP